MARHTRTLLGLGALLTSGALALTACGSGFQDQPGTSEESAGGGALNVLIAASGDAEKEAVESAIAAWSEESGVEATVQVANDLPQQLSQGFAAGSPPDLFYLAPEALAGYSENESIAAYGGELGNVDDFYPSLVENFTLGDEFYCAPKDFSTLGLIINSDVWAEAGLTEADIPTDWQELASVAQRLTAPGRAGLAFGAEYQRIGAFMAQAGGGMVVDGKAAANTPENVEALTFVKDQLNAGTFAFASDIGAGWGGEAFGTGTAAMVIEGNWIVGALANDYPDVNYTVAELPEGPGGKGTLQFTNCWGIATDSANQESARELVEYLTATEQQLAFSKAFGPMPSIESAADAWTEANPELEAFLAGAEYAQFPPNQAGAADVITDFNAQLESLKTGDPKAILDSVQSNLEAIVE